LECRYSVFHRFRQAKFACGGSILSSSQFSVLTQLPLKLKLVIKVVKINLKKNHIVTSIQIGETDCSQIRFG
jgi:hypothetical protein